MVQRQRSARLRLVPGREYHLGGPTRVPETDERLAAAHGERVRRAVCHAEEVVDLARWTDALPVVRREYLRMSFYTLVHSVGAKARAQSARDAAVCAGHGVPVDELEILRLDEAGFWQILPAGLLLLSQTRHPRRCLRTIPSPHLRRISPYPARL